MQVICPALATSAGQQRRERFLQAKYASILIWHLDLPSEAHSQTCPPDTDIELESCVEREGAARRSAG